MGFVQVASYIFPTPVPRLRKMRRVPRTVAVRPGGGGNSSSRFFSFLNSLGSAFGKGTIQSSLKQLRRLIVVAQLWIVFLMLFFFPSNLLL